MPAAVHDAAAAAHNSAAQPHVVLVPVPSQGHINPFNTIAHFLAASGVSVTLVLSDHNHSALLSSTRRAARHADDQSTLSLIRVEVVPDYADMLPSSDPRQRFSVDNFRASLSAMRNGVEQLLEKLMQEKQAPCCLLVDSLLCWGHDVALKFALPRVDVWTCSASVFAMGWHLPELVARGYIPASGEGSKEKTIDFIPGLSPFTVADLPESLTGGEGLQSSSFQFFSSMFVHAKNAERLLVNTVHELESSTLNALTKEGVPIHPVGPLFMFSASVSLLQEDNSCLSWLDKRPNSSVLYISFGSIASIEEDVIGELAHGLEASGESFLWVIRPDAFAGKASVEELLPEGFMERTRERGLVISWAPQLAVLGHPSVGAFLTHCGWNSVLESLSNGIPMLGFPQLAEQNTNLKHIVKDWKVGLPLLVHSSAEADAGKVVVERSRVQCAVTSIMRGEEVRNNALAWREVAHRAPHGTSKSNLQKLVDDLKIGLLKPSH